MSATPPRLERVYALFAAAVSLDPHERDAMIDEACTNDPELRREVEELLALDAAPLKAGELTQGAGSEWLAADLADLRDEQEPLPASIGPFQIVREIGRGGMGVVYEAQQDEPARRVAFKVIHPGMISRGLLRRFRQETRAMAQLRHPGIAQIYEAGASATGEGGGMRPYFVMELVEGPSLVKFAAAEGLDVPARLELVARVCDALHHAHQKGVVHRDLKPDNILVQSASGPEAGATGTLSIGVQPKILDFGVARLVEEQDTNSLRTMAGQIVGTIPYLSPEQALGESSVADIRSDVYSVGVILYELLSGRLPFDTKDRTVRAAVRAVLNTEPRRLGTVERSLRGDVEAIVHKAMEREPERRYQSAADLAADLRRYLRSEPIEARVPSTLYAVGKFVQRHRSLVSVGAASVVMLIGAVVVMSMLWVQAKRAENEAVWQRYRSAMSAAGFALSKGDIGIARQQMESVSPRFRGWEYRHFLSRLDQSIATQRPAMGAPYGVVSYRHDGADGFVLVNPERADPVVWIAREDAGSETRPLDARLTLWFAAMASRPVLLHSLPIGGFLAPRPSDGKRMVRELGARIKPGDYLKSPRVSEDGSVMMIIRVSGERFSLLRIDLESGDVSETELGVIATLCAVSSDGSVVAVATGFREEDPPHIRVMDARTGAVISSIRDNPGEATSILLSDDGTRLIGSFQNGDLQCWDVSASVPAKTATVTHAGGGLENLTFNEDRTLIAAGGMDGLVRVFDAVSLEQQRELVGHEAEIHDVAFLPGNTGLVSVGRDGKLRRWDLGMQRERPLSLRGHTHLVHALAIAERSGLVVTGSWDRTVRVFKLESGCEVASAPTGTFVQALALSPDERLVATREYEGDVRVFEVGEAGLRQIALLDRKMKRLDQPAFDSDSKRVLVDFDPATATATFWDIAAAVWVTAPGAEVASCISTTVHRVAGLIAIPEQRDRWFGAVLYDVRSGREVLAIPTRRTATESIAFTPDDRFVVAPDGNHQIQVYELASGRIVASFTGHSREVLAMAFTPDGSRLFSADLTGTIYVWDTGTREEITQLRGHDEHVRRLIVSSDGQMLISGSRDGTARVWGSSNP